MALTYNTTAGVQTVNMTDVDGSVVLNGTPVAAASVKTATYTVCANGSIGTTTFFIADRAYMVVGISYMHKTQGTVVGAACSVTKERGVLASGAGVALQSAVFDCHTIANATVTSATLTATPADLSLVSGDRLSVLFAGTLTTLAGVTVTVYMVPAEKVTSVSYYCKVNADIKTQTFFIANRDMVVTGVKAVYGTAFAGAVTIDVVKDTTTGAAGAGTSILTAAMAGDGTAATVISPALAASAATLALAAGDRLAVLFSATTTGANVCITVTFAAHYNEKAVIWQLAPNTQQAVAQAFFIADREYEVIDGSCIFDVTAGGAAKVGITIDKGTTTPGGGIVVDTTNSSAGFDMAATARTVQYIAPAIRSKRLMSAGDRLGLKVSGSAGNTVLTCVTVNLIPR